MRTWIEKGEFQIEEIGYIDDSSVTDDNYDGKTVANFIVQEVRKIGSQNSKGNVKGVNVQQVRNNLLRTNLIFPRDMPAIHHVSKNFFNKLVEWITLFVNQQIKRAVHEMEIQYSNFLPPIAIDETIANVIRIRDDDPPKNFSY